MWSIHTQYKLGVNRKGSALAMSIHMLLFGLPAQFHGACMLVALGRVQKGNTPHLQSYSDTK